MLFDFETFSRLAAKAYSELSTPYSIGEVLEVFRCYFSTYEQETGRPHPRIRMEQIKRIIQVMPWIDQNDRGAYQEDVSTEDYRYIIHKHFKTKYHNCDYNINHFFSGRVRELRFYEECY